jgi:hypothetical protein
MRSSKNAIGRAPLILLHGGAAGNTSGDIFFGENDVFIMFWIKLENAKKQRPQILGCVAL